MKTVDKFIIKTQMCEKMFECARDINLIISTFTGKILKANKEAVKSYGYSVEELLNMTIFQLIGISEDAILQFQTQEASIEGIIPEVKHYRKDGSFFWAEVISINIGNNEDILLSRITNITKRKEKDVEFSKIEEKYGQLYQSMNQGIAFNEIVLDGDPGDYRYIKVDKSFQQMLGITEEQIVGKTVLIIDIAESELREKKLRDNYEELSAVYQELFASQEELTGNYKKMEILKKEAELSNKAKSQFLSNMSHEIRTPLNGISGMAQLLELTLITTEQKEYMDMLNQSTDHLLNIINDILDICKIEAGKLELTKEPFNLKSNLEKLVKIFELDGVKKNVKVFLNYQSILDQEFIGDELRLNQILVNLLGNSIKFTEVGTVNLSVRKIGGFKNKIKLEFSVEDTGIGINKDLKNKLFKLFKQGDSSYTKKYGGTGLGLAICKDLVAMMSGEIWYESEVNEGTTFYFVIELEKQEKAKEVQKDYKVDEINVTEAKNNTILVAEDNDINQILVCKYIQMLGFEYICVSTGIEALKVCEKEKVDLILMDIQMPEMNGFQATKEIRKNEVNTLVHVPIIAMTAYAMSGDKELCIEAGMDDYICKPLDLDLLKEKIQKFI